jgi:luciferase family oxidoreductase group 1
MTTTLRLSVLDQSIVRKGGTAGQALNETIETARLAEQWGYHRFWVSEHHNSEMIAGSAPEILMVKLGDETKKIRIGSGGIMLPNHSAYKVAENFRLLESLFPGRIDLGMGRAPGGDRISASLLNPSNTFSEESYLRQLEHLQAFFNDEAGTQYGKILASPITSGVPEQWILSSSGGSAAIAAKFGHGLVVARFINGHAGGEITDIYREMFLPSAGFDKPQVMFSVSVLCADTREKADQLRKLADFNLLKFEQGRFEPMGSYDEIADYEFSESEKARIENNKGRIISGTPREVKEQLLQLANIFGADEAIITTMTYSHEDRLRSFELIAKEMGG